MTFFRLHVFREITKSRPFNKFFQTLMNPIKKTLRYLLQATMLVSLALTAQAQSADTIKQLLNSVQSMGMGSSGLGALSGAGLNLNGAGTGQVPQIGSKPDLGADLNGTGNKPFGSQNVAGQANATNLQQQQAAPVPTQFQRYVQQMTGKLLPHFGDNLFQTGNDLTNNAYTNAPAPDNYVLGPGDEVNIRLSGGLDAISRQTLDRNGLISIDKMGSIGLAGTALRELQPTLEQWVARTYKGVKVDASLGKLRGVTVYVVGYARQPGAYNLSSLSTVLNAVFASGGPSNTGTMRDITLTRSGKVISKLDLYSIITKGDKSQDATLQGGDVITIPAAVSRVALLGATDGAGIYEIKPGETVQDLLALSGGLPALASNIKAILERIDNTQTVAHQMQSLLLDAKGLSEPLRNADVLTLLAVSPEFNNTVTLKGAVAQAIRHRWFRGMRVSDLIPNRSALILPDYFQQKNKLVQNNTAKLLAQGLSPEQIQAIQAAQNAPVDVELVSKTITNDSSFDATSVSGKNVLASKRTLQNEGMTLTDQIRGMQDQINWDYAVVERLDRVSLRSQLIHFNLSQAIAKDPANDVELLSGDVLTVLSSQDLQLPAAKRTRLVRVEGEVNAPGVYQIAADETVQQLLKRIGGVSAQAYIFGTEFTRESVRKEQQRNLDQLTKRLELQANNTNANLAANLRLDNPAQLQAVLQQQKDEMRSQIDRLKQFKSKGRVSLELKPALNLNLRDLPDLALNDGDGILIPTRPSFVSAIGSVNNENVFIYKDGKTVADVLKSAGVTLDADPKQIFVLRADGAVVGNLNSGFFSNFDTTTVMPGDIVFVPPKMDRETGYNFLVRSMKDWTQILSNFGIGAAALRSLGY